ncbi:uncharacterized protein [Spinacia oleracea]|uniref:Ribosome maturation protein SDO1/SBDS central domain-containing protein n=1 Tax=Spinacia oleracea TaxID=3562 RepID=A0ABM3QSP6_SPIOL|nr:uncharacterized protein LOC130462057 [Spinacia oleracea]
MENTINPDTKCPYSITMIERLMHDIHFAVDPYNSSKKQALDVIHRLVKKFPIKRSPMRLRLTVGEKNFSTILEKLGTWNGEIVTMDESGTQFSVDDQKMAARLANTMCNSLKGRPALGRIFQGKEPPQFVAIFSLWLC